MSSFVVSKNRAGDRSRIEHNQTVLDCCNPGDLLEFTRGIYSHWGVYVGDERVIHLTGDNDGISDNSGNPSHVFSVWGKQFGKAVVKCESFWDIVDDCKAKINNGKDRDKSPATAEDIIERAFSRLGEIGYNVLWHNCEHFAKWCRYGKKESDQVNGFLTFLGVSAAAVTAGVLIAKAFNSDTEKEDQKKQNQRY